METLAGVGDVKTAIDEVIREALREELNSFGARYLAFKQGSRTMPNSHQASSEHLDHIGLPSTTSSVFLPPDAVPKEYEEHRSPTPIDHAAISSRAQQPRRLTRKMSRIQLDRSSSKRFDWCETSDESSEWQPQPPTHGKHRASVSVRGGLMSELESFTLPNLGALPEHDGHEKRVDSRQTVLAAVPTVEFVEEGSIASLQLPASKTKSLTRSQGLAADTLFTPHSSTMVDEVQNILSHASFAEGTWWCCSGRLRCKMIKFVECMPFDLTISTFIFLNALCIGVQTNYMIHNIGDETPAVFTIIELIFVVIFAVEVLLRVIAYGHFFFHTSDRLWNIYDTVIVVLQVAEKLVTIAHGNDLAESKYSFMRFLRILRLTRVLRIVRLLRFVQELRTMVLSIASAFRHLCWTLVLLLLMMYAISVGFCQLIVDRGKEQATIMDDVPGLRGFFGNVPCAIRSLYQAMTGGVDWNELVLALEQGALPDPWVSILFSMYIAFAVLALMNVVTGVFVNNALLTAQDDKEMEMKKQVRRLFHLAEKSEDGTINWQDFEQAWDQRDMVQYFKSIDIDRSEARGLFLLLDTNESGQIDAEEFTQGCVRLRGQARAIDLATLMYFNKRMVTWWKTKMTKVERSLQLIYDCLSYDPDAATSDASMKPYRSRCTNDQLPEGCRLADIDNCFTLNQPDNVDEIFATWAEIKASAQARDSQTFSSEDR